MDKELFSGLKDLGFDNVEGIDLYNKEKKEEEKDEKEEMSDIEREKSLLFNREVTCPVCGSTFHVKAIKKEGYKYEKRDSDSFVHYISINPYFYDVWICNSCGYAAMEADFFKVKAFQIEFVKEKITPKWQGKSYPETYDVNIAIERYKIALLNYFFIESPASKKAMTCLRLGWMYRILKDEEKEASFLKQAIEGFETAYYDEGFPIYKMDKFTVLYLLGELNRRIGEEGKALSWFSQIITSTTAPQKLKDKTRDQRDLISEAQAARRAKPAAISTEKNDEPVKKEGFFSKIFKK